MSERARERRRSRPGRDEAERPPDDRAADPRLAGLLALQRTAGNQAVQRLMYTQASKTLRVPRSYADQRIPFAGGYLQDRTAKETDPTFLELANQDQGALRPHIATGVNVPKVDAVAAIDDAQMATGAATLADSSATAGTDARLRAVATAANELLVYPGPPTKYYDPTDLQTNLVLQAKDFFPEAADLPAPGFKVRDQIPKAMAGQKLWNLVCVLIALVKAQGGYNKAAAITQANAGKLDEAVQALHDYYAHADRNVQYDDTSSRFPVMNQWGYTPVFSGKVRWEDLPTHVALPAGEYIFDIVGHTVLVEVLQPIALGGPAIPTAQLKQWFTTKSEKDNYAKDELKQDVQYIWKK